MDTEHPDALWPPDRPDPGTDPPRDPTAPLLVTGDELLLAELLPLAAAADVTPTVTADPEQALAVWSRAGAVLVGADVAAALAGYRPETRPQVYVVDRAPVPDGLFRTALELGARQVVDLPASAAWLVDLLTDLTERRADGGRVIGVIGGAGGAGATMLACALAQRAAASGPTALIDCDPQGPGLDRILGMERTDGFRWDALCRTTGRLSARAFREALPRRKGLGVLSWYVDSAPQTLQAFAVREALSAARRGHDTVVVDLPRSGDRLVDEIAARCDRLLILTPDTLVGAAGAARMRGRFAAHPGLGLVIRGERVAADEIAAAVRLEVVAQMRDQRGLDEAVDLGLGPLRSRRGPLARAVDEILAAVEWRASA